MALATDSAVGIVRTTSKTDALIHSANRIRVNSIHPGFIWTPPVEPHLATVSGDVQQHRREVGALHPLDHMREPDNIAWSVVYPASDEAKPPTGGELAIDGGYTRR